MFSSSSNSSLLLILTFTVHLACTERHHSAPTRLEEIEHKSCTELEETLIFERRIRPLVEEAKEPSCARCHLPGVDFRPFIQEDECQTLACLAEEHLVNLSSPSESKMLSWIIRGHEVLNVQIEDDPLVHAEYEAFNLWITYQAKCHQQLCEANLEPPCGEIDTDKDLDLSPPYDQELISTVDMDLDISVVDEGFIDGEVLNLDMQLPPPPPEDLCSEDGVLYRFLWEVWPLHGRCYHCHADRYSERSTQTPPPTAWMSNHREDLGAERTLARLLASEYLNFEEPSQSLILLKPLSEEAGGLPHGGGTKMRSTEDSLYLSLLAWIEHLAECRDQGH